MQNRKQTTPKTVTLILDKLKQNECGVNDVPVAPAAEPPASELGTALYSCHPERVHRSDA